MIEERNTHLTCINCGAGHLLYKVQLDDAGEPIERWYECTECGEKTRDGDC